MASIMAGNKVTTATCRATLKLRVPVHRNNAGGGIYIQHDIVRQPRDQALTCINAVAVATYHQYIIGAGFHHAGQLAQITAVLVTYPQPNQVTPIKLIFSQHRQSTYWYQNVTAAK